MSSEALHLGGSSVTDSSSPALPAVAATFLVRFDDRKGYTVAWQRTISPLDVEGVVEFKSMPSGLHNVKEDLVYFVHEDYAGVSAVLNVEDERAARKAMIIAVGVLVPLEHGRMGKSWLFATVLKQLAETQIRKGDDFSLLEEFWNKHQLPTSPQPHDELESPKTEPLSINTGIASNGYKTNRSMSIGGLNGSADYQLPAHHPAIALPDFVHQFGPLLFPLLRAALLRKRILFLGEAPVERTCNFVYNLSVLSSIPKPIIDLLPHIDPSYLRLRLLLNIGVSDIPTLESKSNFQHGWIACTTDDVLCTKTDLFDILVVLPGATAQTTDGRAYPKLYMSSTELSRARPRHGLRASPRDAKRYATLWRGLRSIPRSTIESARVDESEAVVSISDSSNRPGSIDFPDNASIASTASSTTSLKSVIEPASWSRIAYTSLVWWASAGDKRSGLSEIDEDEDEQDMALLTGENLGDSEHDVLDQDGKTREIACVQYFHRLCNMIFTAASEAVNRSNGHEHRYRDEDDQGVDTEEHDDNESPLLRTNESNGQKRAEQSLVEITQEDVQNMGLDSWSDADRQFIEELISVWWNRTAEVKSGRIDCCGVRIL